MKIKILTQAEKQHSVNRLHDAFITAEIPPLHAESTTTESRFTFEDSVTDPAIQAVIDAYIFSPPSVLVDLKLAWQNYKNAVSNATTVAQIKSALTSELGIVLKELARHLDSSLS